MIDITGPKVLIPTLLFALLSPGLIVSLPPGQDPKVQLAFHAVVLALVYWIVAKFVAKVSLTTADLIVPAVLFILLTPGTLLTLPPGARGPIPVFVHAIVFAILFALMRKTFAKYY